MHKYFITIVNIPHEDSIAVIVARLLKGSEILLGEFCHLCILLIQPGNQYLNLSFGQVIIFDQFLEKGDRCRGSMFIHRMFTRINYRVGSN